MTNLETAIKHCAGGYTKEYQKATEEETIKINFCNLIEYHRENHRLCPYQGTAFERVDGDGVTHNYRCTYGKKE